LSDILRDEKRVSGKPFSEAIKEIAIMALTILEDCINCDACRVECPTESVRAGEDIYEIDPNTCV
jgi:ferredoxin